MNLIACEAIMLIHQVPSLLVCQRALFFTSRGLIKFTRVLVRGAIGGSFACNGLILVVATMVYATSAMDQKPDSHSNRRFIVREEPDGWYLVDTHTPKYQQESISADKHESGVYQPSNPYDKVSRVLRQADEFLDAARSGTFEKPVEPLLMKLQKTQRLLFALMRRTSPTFVQEVIRAHADNVASVGLDPKKAYEYFGISPQEAITLDYSYFKKIIKRERSSEFISGKTKSELRQLEYVFANGPAEEEYRAYLQGRCALAKLILSKQDAERVRTQLNQVIQYTLVVQAVRNDLTAVARAIPTSIPQEILI